jgi:pSer/pThr/pTyr-binding forkhead associated (FHA) protein
VVVAGKLRGKEFALKEGENIVGRDASVDVPIVVDGVSKKHFSINVTGDVAYIQDLGSSNGTFINGKIVKKGTVKAGDKVAIPDTIFHLVHLLEKKVVVKKKVSAPNSEGSSTEDNGLEAPQKMPSNIPGKILYLFRYKIMPIVYGINLEYEWRILLGIIVAVYAFAVVSFTLFPILQGNKKILIIETSLRGEQYADEIARTNARALEQKNLDAVDTSFLDKARSIGSYELFDLEGRIVRPIGKMNDFISDTFSVKAKEWALSNSKDSDNTYKKILEDNEIGIAQKILAYNPKTSSQEPVGIIAIRFRPETLDVMNSKNNTAYFESIAIAGLIAVFFYGIIYFAGLRPIDEARVQLEDALRGKRALIETKQLFGEMKSFVDTINTILQRLKELQSDGSQKMFENEPDTSYVNQLSDFMKGAGVPAMVIDSEKKIQRVNTEAEDMTGIRESSAAGTNILDVAREKGFAATMIELCDNCANNNGSCQEGDYELQGIPRKIYVNGLMGKDGFAKAFLITFVKV